MPRDPSPASDPLAPHETAVGRRAATAATPTARRARDDERRDEREVEARACVRIA